MIVRFLTQTSCVALGAFLVACASTETTPVGDNQLSRAEKEQGWILLFDGKTLDGWMTSAGQPSATPVEDGCINPHKCGDYMMVHKEQWSDFVLCLDFQIAPRCNSGIFVRTYSLEPHPGKDVGYNGIEMAIDDTETAGYVDTGALYDLVKPTRNAMKRAGEWNHVVITCSRSLIDVEVNGEKVTTIDLDEWTEPGKRPDGTSHKFGVAYRDHPRKGYFGLQDHGGKILFKNIKLKPLS